VITRGGHGVIVWTWWRFKVRAEFNRGTWRWQQPYGNGPRWVRRAWCLLFHWRRFDTLGGSDCGVVPSQSADGTWRLPLRPWFYLMMHRRSYGPDARIYEHIDNRGCGRCGFSWRRRYRYDMTSREGEIW